MKEIPKPKGREVESTTSTAGMFVNYAVNKLATDSWNTGNIFEEMMFSIAGSVLTIFDIESMRNECLYNRRIPRKKYDAIGHGFINILSKIQDLPQEQLGTVLKEVFVFRDAIAHGHLYDLKTKYQWVKGKDKFKEYTLKISHNHKKIPRKMVEQGDPKFEENINKSTKKTKILKLNVLPHKVDFSDFFTVLLVLDVLNGLHQKAWGRNLGIFYDMFEVEGRYISDPQERADVDTDLNGVLAHYYRKKQSEKKHEGKRFPKSSRGKRFITKVDKTLRCLEDNFNAFIKTPEKTGIQKDVSTSFINNRCRKCGAFGFQTPFYYYGKCWKCRHEDPREKSRTGKYAFEI